MAGKACCSVTYFIQPMAKRTTKKKSAGKSRKRSAKKKNPDPVVVLKAVVAAMDRVINRLESLDSLFKV